MDAKSNSTQATDTKSSIDLLFILTADLHCALLGFNAQTNCISNLSHGNLNEQTGSVQRLDPPYAVFLD